MAEPQVFRDMRKMLNECDKRWLEVDKDSPVRKEIRKDLLKLRDVFVFLEVLQLKYGIDVYLKIHDPNEYV